MKNINRFFKKDATAKVLLLLYLVLFIVCAINPFDRADWWAENIPIVGIVVALTVAYVKGYKFSATSYVLMAFLIIIHTIGGHYTFERVPFGFVSHLFGFGRNHYDRMGHFTVGFFAFAFAEIIDTLKLSKSRVLTFMFALFAIGFVAMGYELIEWIFAVTSNSQSGANFLGSQGDIWDAQKDMLADTLGAITILIAYYIFRVKKLSILKRIV